MKFPRQHKLVLCFILLVLVSMLLAACGGGDNVNMEGSQAVETETPGIFSLGEVIITNTDLTQVLATDRQTLPNCNGSSELTIRRAFSKTTETRIEYTTNSAISLEISSQIPFVNLEADITMAISESTERTEGTSIQETIEVEMAAAPGTAVTYEIVWLEVFTAGVVEIIETKGNDENLFFQEFTITSSLRAELSDERSDCENS